MKVCPSGVYNEYADRGESENRNKELKCELCCDRLSDHRFMANLFRVMMHCVAANLLVRLRQVVEVEPEIDESAFGELPPEAESPANKRRHHTRRRRRDPLGQGHACTWADACDQGGVPRDREHAAGSRADLIELAVGRPSSSDRGGAFGLPTAWPQLRLNELT